MSYQSLLRGLVQREVAFIVVGGVAAVAHGSARITNDPDVCYDAAPANLDRLITLLGVWKAYPKGWEPGLQFILDQRTFRTTPLLTLNTIEGELDVMADLPGVGDYGRVLRSSIEIHAFGVRFRVLTLDALISSKRAAGREKDLAQLPELEALRGLRKRSSQ